MLFKKCLLEFIRPKANSIFNIHSSIGIKYLTRLRLSFSHLKEHNFQHNFQDSAFFSIALTLVYKKKTLFDKLAELNIDVLTRNDDYIVLHCKNSVTRATRFS